jgi:hypothetical protein
MGGIKEGVVEASTFGMETLHGTCSLEVMKIAAGVGEAGVRRLLPRYVSTCLHVPTSAAMELTPTFPFGGQAGV